MTTACPPSRRPGADGFSRGTNQIGVRLYNERLILSLIRRLGSVPKAEIARLTGLSAQTVSVIMRELEADGLVLKRDPQRGRVGQPSVPFQLDSRRRLRARPEDRPAQLRHGAARLRRRGAPRDPADPSLSHARRGARVRPREPAAS